MRSVLATLSAICLVASIATCGHHYSRTRNTPASRSADDSDAIHRISLERTGCYGNCPIYALTIDGQGNTRLLLEAFSESAREDVDDAPTLVQVVYAWTLPEDRRTAVVDLIDSRAFRSLDLDYSIPVTDGEMRTISLFTRRGHWSTSVYVVPCERQASEWGQESIARQRIERLVPDVFCEAEDLLHRVACDTMTQGVRIGRARDVRLFNPPSCSD